MGSSNLDIEDFGALLAYLREKGHAGSQEVPSFIKLAGGVSNRTVLVQYADGRAVVLKQALQRLRVPTEWTCDPRRITREALGLTWLRQLAPSESITPLLFLDAEHHLLAMEAVPQPHQNWKSVLLTGGLQAKHVQQFAKLLAIIHRRSQADSRLAAAFEDRTFFKALRLEPYYWYTAQQVEPARCFLEELIAETLATRQALVHGDYSPKNVLIHQDRLVLLDHEVIHYGDPAFDIGFSATHLLSKAHHLPMQRTAFLQSARAYWLRYVEEVGSLAASAGFERRAVRHTLACLLARVRGRSPLEYLAEPSRRRQEQAVLGLIGEHPTHMLEVVEGFAKALK